MLMITLEAITIGAAASHPAAKTDSGKTKETNKSHILSSQRKFQKSLLPKVSKDQTRTH